MPQRHCNQQTWPLLEEYYNKINETAVDYSAITLHQVMKLQWFRDEWHDSPSWISAAEKAVRPHQGSECQTKVPLVRPSLAFTPTAVIMVTEEAPNVLHRKSKKHQWQAADTLDHFEPFQEQDPEDKCPSGAHQYWVERLDDPC